MGSQERMKGGKPWRVLQVNTNRCHAAHDLLEARIKERDVEVVLVSEPNDRRVKDGWYRDGPEGDVAILVKGRAAQQIRLRGVQAGG